MAESKPNLFFGFVGTAAVDGGRLFPIFSDSFTPKSGAAPLDKADFFVAFFNFGDAIDGGDEA